MILDTPDDRVLIAQARQGNATAFGEVVRRYQNAVFSVCYRLLGNRQEAEDMAQVAFMRAYQRLHTFDLARPFLPWMRRVAANVCFNKMERHQLETVEWEEKRDLLSDPTQKDPAEVVEAEDAAAHLYAAVVALPSAYRAVIELRHFQELSYEEITDLLQLPINTVKSHLFRARKLLAEVLTAYESV